MTFLVKIFTKKTSITKKATEPDEKENTYS